MHALLWCTRTQSSWAKGIGSFPTWITHFRFRCSKASCLSTLNCRILFSTAHAYTSARNRASHSEYQKPAFYFHAGLLRYSILDGRWVKAIYISNKRFHTIEMKKGKGHRELLYTVMHIVSLRQTLTKARPPSSILHQSHAVVFYLLVWSPSLHYCVLTPNTISRSFNCQLA